MNNIKTSMLKSASIAAIISGDEQFIFEIDGDRFCGNLKTVNQFANDFHQNVNVLYSVYRTQRHLTATIFNMQNGDRAFYDASEREFFAS